MDARYTSTDVCHATAVSYRQLDHWATVGAVRPTVQADGSGTARRWSDADAVRVAMLGALRSSGVSLTRATGLLDAAGDLLRLGGERSAIRLDEDHVAGVRDRVLRHLRDRDRGATA